MFISSRKNLSEKSHNAISFQQEEMLKALISSENKKIINNFLMTFRLAAGTCPDALRAAFNVVVDRHESLRSTFTTDAQGRPALHIADALELALPLVELPPEAARQYVGGFAAAPFDLGRGPLLRACLVQDGGPAPLLVIATHHIVSDGWSEGVLTRELQHVYDAALRNVLHALPPLPVQYADYALWQRGRDMSSELAYWTGTLADYEDGLALPYDYPRPATRAWRARRVSWKYPAELARAAAAFSHEHNATLFMTLLGALGLVLQRYTGRDDLCIGTTTAGREVQELEGLIGFFVNILPLRLDLSDTPDGRTVLRRVRQTVLDAAAHQALPFEHLLNALRRERDTGQVPLVPVMARHQNFRGASLGALAAEADATDADSGPRIITSELDIQFRGDGEALEVCVEYAADLFSAETVLRLLGHHQHLLAQMVQEAGPAAGYELLTAEEQAQLRGWQPATRAPLTTCVPALFEARVREHPDAPACLSAEGAISYAQLNRQANRLAHALRAAGVQRGARVAICLPRTPDYLAALLGVLKADGCYVTLDPEYPAAYLEQIAADAKPLLIVTQRSLSGRLPAGHRRLCVDDAQLAEGQEENPVSAAGPEDVAYIMYTSGSTGRPKGVMVPHRQVLNVLASLWRLMPLGGDEVVAHKTSAAFAVAVKELLSGLLAGRPVAFIPADTVKEARAFSASLAALKVTRLYIVPSHLESLLAEPDAALHLRGLRHCVTAGEPLPASLAGRAQKMLPELQLWNNYGCSELNDITYRCVSQADGAPDADSIVPAGRPIDNSGVYVVDGQRRQLPVGVTGEICVAGAGVSLGYFGQAELTAEKFIASPFPGTGPTLYLTGDTGRVRADGSLEYCGRQDFDVKIRGYRIDVRQVEEALLLLPGMREAVVGAVQESSASRQLVAWVVWQEGASLMPQELRERLLAKLPAYMVPGLYVPLDALPRLPNGKLDRRSLPAPTASAGRMAFVAPREGTEQRLAALWESVLQLSGISADDNFFSLGGHSLLAMQLCSKIKETFNVDVPVNKLMIHPSISALSYVIDNEKHGMNEKELIVDLKAINAKSNLFLIHPVGGEVSMYFELSKYIDEDHNVLALQSGEIAGLNESEENINELARTYGEYIRRRQSHGPYKILGWSSGGLFAYAVVKYLENTGECVSYFGAIDPSPFNKSSYSSKDLFIEAIIVTLSSVIKRLISFSERNSIVEFILKNEIYHENVCQVRTAELIHGLLSDLSDELIPEKTIPLIVNRILITMKHLALIKNLSPIKINARVDLYLPSKDNKDGCPLSLGGWEKEFPDIGEISYSFVCGNHYNMVLEPNVRGLASLINSKMKL